MEIDHITPTAKAGLFHSQLKIVGGDGVMG
jgi:hypothetical protein